MQEDIKSFKKIEIMMAVNNKFKEKEIEEKNKRKGG